MLSIRYGTGYNQRNIERMCLFNKMFSNTTPGSQYANVFEDWFLGSKSQNINWSHIRELLIFKDIKVIQFYLEEVESKKLSKRQLISYIKSHSYERTIINQKEDFIKNDIEKTLKDPVILNISNRKRTEKELEDEIVDNILVFKKEIGNIVAFYERQYKININGLIHKVDLVFLDYETNTFILIDLKIGKVTNQDIMQMRLYIDYFSKEMSNKCVNVIGLVLCETKDLRVICDDNIYQIRYLNEIPKDKELIRIINENKVILLKTENLKLDK